MVHGATATASNAARARRARTTRRDMGLERPRDRRAVHVRPRQHASPNPITRNFLAARLSFVQAARCAVPIDWALGAPGEARYGAAASIGPAALELIGARP